MAQALTTEIFIERARAIHGDKYDYSKVAYKNNSTKVCIICRRHHLEFWQAPHNHWSGKGCPKCRYEKMARSLRRTNEQFTTEAQAVHGPRYDYSQVSYVNSVTKVKIVCLRHGPFWQLPPEHLCGKGCPECGNETIGHKLRTTTEQFIEKARQVHGDKYDYSQVQYTTSRANVIIICPEHGPFRQRVTNHLAGRGCRKCCYSSGERDIAHTLTDLGIPFETQKEFKGCKDKKRLRFDFFFVYRNRRHLVEYQGEQHFRPVPFFEEHSAGKHKWFKRHDRIKRQFAADNDIALIEVPYTVSNVRQFLLKQLGLA